MKCVILYRGLHVCEAIPYSYMAQTPRTSHIAYAISAYIYTHILHGNLPIVP